MEVPQRRRSQVILSYALRGIYTTIAVILNYFIFFVVPRTLFSYTGQLTPDIEATTIGFFIVIEVLTVIRIMLKDHLLGVASSVGLSIVHAVYIYSATQGGALTLSLSDFFVTIDFKPILYMMLTIPLLGIVRQMFELLSKSSAKSVNTIEVVN